MPLTLCPECDTLHTILPGKWIVTPRKGLRGVHETIRRREWIVVEHEHEGRLCEGSGTAIR